MSDHESNDEGMTPIERERVAEQAAIDERRRRFAASLNRNESMPAQAMRGASSYALDSVVSYIARNLDAELAMLLADGAA